MTLQLIESILLILLVLVSLSLIGLVLLQQGKGANIGAAFGGGGANSVFGSVGPANFLQRITTWLAIGFFAITFGLAYIAAERARSDDAFTLPDAPPASAGEQTGGDADVPFGGMMDLDVPQVGADGQTEGGDVPQVEFDDGMPLEIDDETPAADDVDAPEPATP